MKFKIIGITDRENSSGLRTKVYTKDDSTNYNDLNRATAIQINGGVERNICQNFYSTY